MGTAVLSTDLEAPETTPRRRLDTALETAQRAVSEAGSLVHLLDAPELADAIPAISRLIARCASVKLNAAHCADLLHVGDLVGARSTSEWVVDVTGTKPGTARKDLDVAARLDDLPVLDEALADGTISATQAGVLSHATGA